MDPGTVIPHLAECEVLPVDALAVYLAPPSGARQYDVYVVTQTPYSGSAEDDDRRPVEVVELNGDRLVLHYWLDTDVDEVCAHIAQSDAAGSWEVAVARRFAERLARAQPLVGKEWLRDRQDDFARLATDSPATD